MTRARRAFLVGFLVTLGATLIAQDGRRVTGVVVTESGRPVVGALVGYMEVATREEQTTRTDDKGLFEFPHGTRGVVTVSARGFGTLKRGWPPRRSRELRFELTSPTVVRGVLLDASTRSPIEGMVTLIVQHPFNHVTKSVQARGTFEFVDLLAGPAILSAQATGFAPHVSLTTIDAGKETETQIGLTLEAAANGTVLDADDTPVADALIYVAYDESMQPGADLLASLVRGHTAAGNEGEFRVAGLVPDTAVTLQAELDGRLSDLVTIEVGPGMERSGIVLRMQ